MTKPTPTIRLITLDDAVLALIVTNLRRIERAHQARVGKNAELIRQIGDQTTRLLAHDRWGGYLAVDEATGDIVGMCAFNAPPGENGEVEIAYFTFPELEGRGYATQMAFALIAIARAAPEVRRVTAHTLPGEGASPSILRKIGMAFLGEVVDPVDGRMWRWEITKQDALSSED